MQWIANDESRGPSPEAEFLDVPRVSANDVSGCAIPSKRTPASCARWHDCTVALRESEKLGEMGDGDFGFEGVKNDVRGPAGLIGVGLRALAIDRLADGGDEGEGDVQGMCGSLRGLKQAVRHAAWRDDCTTARLLSPPRSESRASLDAPIEVEEIDPKPQGRHRGSFI
jgi:hypothetical protein